MVTTHTEAGYQLHVIQLDIRDYRAYTARLIRTQPFDSGEVTALGLWEHPGQGTVYAVACLWRDKAVYIEFHSLTSDLSVETLAVHDRKSGLNLQATDKN